MKQSTPTLALYTRMSREDEDVGAFGSKSESNSITNQRLLLQDYLSSHPEFRGWAVREFCDDGFSGKRLDRPQFNEMLELVRKGQIQCIIVKDLSRFCRDYIEMGNYLEQLFPFLGVRFIAVTDHYDSKEKGPETLGLDISFKNFIADFYSRDTSKKLRSVRREMAKEGKFASANAPYGYQKSPEDKHRLIIDEETAPIVRRIYRLKLAGLSARKITRMLNQAGVPSPAQYALQKKRGMDWRRINETCGWDPSKVVAILKDERYAGNMVSLKRTLKGIYGKDSPTEKENWVRIPGTHEAIISYEDFLRTQDTFLVYEKGQPEQIDRTNAFVCGHCGRKLSVTRDHKKLICRYGEVNPQAVCANAAYSAAALRGAVMKGLQWHFELFLHWEQLKAAQQERSEAELDTSLYEKSIGTLEKRKTRLYESYRDGSLTRDEYKIQRAKLNEELANLQSRIQEIETKRSMLQEDDARIDLLSGLVHQYRDTQHLTKELERIFVEQVLVYDAKHIQIKWKFDDVFSDYPVPFTELLIYPNRIVTRPKTAQVLHEEEGASYGGRTRETVYLYEENGRTSLVCEKKRRDEHTPQNDSEWSMKARLSLVPQPCHRIPLTKWALSLPWKDLRQYTDEVCVRMDGTPTEDKFKRYRRIKEGRMKNSHDQPGWNCTYDAIGLGFDSPDVWHLCRTNHWREAPSGLPYNVTIVMKLRPGVEKESDETLCGMLDSLPWWNPDSADRLMWDARNWLDADWLQKQAEFNNSMHRKNPRIDGYEKALDEVLKQLCLLEGNQPAEKDTGKSSTVNRWVNLIGKPGEHGDVIRIGFGGGKCFLEITNDGFPHGGAGGMTVTVPSDVIVGRRLDARKFVEFYRSVYPCGVPIDDFSDRIWIYTPTQGRPEGAIEIIQHLSTRENRDGAAFSFEKSITKRELVKAGGQLYLRITDYECSSGGNGRPLYSLIEDYHVAYTESTRLITADSGLRFAAKSAAYRYEENGTGVLF